LLLLDNRFLGALLRAFENRPGPISLVFKSAKYVFDGQLSSKKLVAQRQQLLKAGQGKFNRFSKAFSKCNTF
jgi:hypothetical protein